MAQTRVPKALGTHVKLWALSRWLYRHRWKRAARIVKAVNFYLHHCLLPPEAEVGEGLRLDHYAHGVVIHPNVTIGNNVRIFHGVTLAAENMIGSEHQIVIGDQAMLGADVKVIGTPGTSLTIGSGARVGAGAVVTNDVPAGETWAGNPAKPIRHAARPST